MQQELPRTKEGRFIKGLCYSPNTIIKKGQHHWRPKKPHWDYDWMYNEYINLQKSTGDIAKQIGTIGANVIYWLKKHNIPRRSMSEVRKAKKWGLYGEKNGMFGRVEILSQQLFAGSYQLMRLCL